MASNVNFTDALSQFVAKTRLGDASEGAQHVLRLSLLDWLAVGIAGCQEPVSKICRDMVIDEAGAKHATVFGTTVKLPARAAALSNGTTSHALDYDDTHFAHIGHPSVAIFSAALAMAEREGSSTRAFLEAALIGMEVSIRVGLWLGRDHYQTGFHQTATAGSFGAAASCAKLLGFDTKQTAATFGLTATRASGLKAQFGTMAKPFNAGIAASNGVEAASLVSKGFAPNAHALEGPLGFGATHSGENATEIALAGLGTDWHFEAVSHKFHACCHGLHATLEALKLLPQIEASNIAGINIRTHPRWMTVCNQPAPTTGLGAKFSYTTVAAMALLGHSTASLDSYTDVLCQDSDIMTLRDKVQVHADSDLSETQSVVSVSLRSESKHTTEFDLDAPMTLNERTTRVRDKARALLGQAQADEIWSIVMETNGPLKLHSILANHGT